MRGSGWGGRTGPTYQRMTYQRITTGEPVRENTS